MALVPTPGDCALGQVPAVRINLQVPWGASKPTGSGHHFTMVVRQPPRGGANFGKLGYNTINC